jgi:hypothetical protein
MRSNIEISLEAKLRPIIKLAGERKKRISGDTARQATSPM